MTPADLYRSCKVTACRLETLQYYADDEEGRQRAFYAGEPLPPPGPGKRDDLQLIEDLRQARRHLGRVHVVGQPLSQYLRYELAAYAENVAAGEEVRIADRSAHPELVGLTTDFTIFDADTTSASVILFCYDEDGRLLGYQHDSSPLTVDRCRQEYTLALAHSVPLDEFPGNGG